MKLAISIPSCRDWKADFGASLAALVRHLTLKDVAFDLNVMKGASVLARARHFAVEWATNVKATHLLFIDDDMSFAPEVIDYLLAREKDIVGCNYLSKATGLPICHDLEGKMVTSEGKASLQEVGWLGFGFILINMESLSGVKRPLFETIWLDDRQDYLGEDFYFCKKVIKNGLRIWCDHDASQRIGHTGDHTFRFKPQIVREVA